VTSRTRPPSCALDGITSVFLYAASSNIDAFVEQAVSAGVEHVVLLSTASVLNPNAEHDRPAKSHLDVEKALAAAPIESTFLRAVQRRRLVETTRTVELLTGHPVRGFNMWAVDHAEEFKS
jgi:hypothetical protein